MTVQNGQPPSLGTPGLGEGHSVMHWHALTGMKCQPFHLGGDPLLEGALNPVGTLMVQYDLDVADVKTLKPKTLNPLHIHSMHMSMHGKAERGRARWHSLAAPTDCDGVGEQLCMPN